MRKTPADSATPHGIDNVICFPPAHPELSANRVRSACLGEMGNALPAMTPLDIQVPKTVNPAEIFWSSAELQESDASLFYDLTPQYLTPEYSAVDEGLEVYGAKRQRCSPRQPHADTGLGPKDARTTSSSARLRGKPRLHLNTRFRPSPPNATLAAGATLSYRTTEV
ncbi:hypothetical protein BDW68DRAFT_179661 [Aspergillus falconensis]